MGLEVYLCYIMIFDIPETEDSPSYEVATVEDGEKFAVEEMYNEPEVGLEFRLSTGEYVVVDIVAAESDVYVARLLVEEV